MSIRVLTPGPLTTVQDGGRDGWRHVGVARAGALDAEAAAMANRLVGNADNAAVLELTLLGPTLQLLQPTRVAICGAEVGASFEDRRGKRIEIAGGRRVDLPTGVLHLGAVHDGLRAWVAFSGGIDAPVILGSRSTDLRGGFGGHQGRALQRGDSLVQGPSPTLNCVTPSMTKWWIDPIDHDHDSPVRFVASQHPAAARLEGSHWHVSARSNRQGLRLEGDRLCVTNGEAVSAAVAPGTVQLPPDGEPIVLLADAQTVGGYQRLGYVIAADLPRLAQWKPGQRLQLKSVDANAAAALLLARRARYARLRRAIADRQR
ncbi:MAG: biotin-dependent carboxyltransferase family protein [Lysobacter sp.]